MSFGGLFVAGGLAVAKVETDPVSSQRSHHDDSSPANPGAEVRNDPPNERASGNRHSQTKELRPSTLRTKRGIAPKSRRAAKVERDEKAHRVHALFRENYKQIWRLLRRFGVPEANADDASQKVFLILSERIDDVREGSERAFLYGTAFRVASGLRRVSHREKPTDLADERRSSLPRPDELADRKQARDLLDRLLARMDDDLRTVFILYELEGFTAPEIADFIAIPLGTAASRLRRARERFRALVAEVSHQEGVAR